MTLSSTSINSLTHHHTPTAGSITANGLYTAPASITAQQTVVVTATSQADPTKSGQAILTLAPGQGVLVTGGVFGHTLDLIAQGICRRAHVAPVVDAGIDQYTSLVCPTGNPPCTATATLTGQASNYSLNAGQTLTYAWSLNTGPGAVQFTNATLASTQASFTATGSYTLQLAVNDGISTSYGITHVYVGAANGDQGSVYISPSASGPNAVNTTLTVQVKTTFQQAGQPVPITVAGANAQTVTATTDANGIATWTYTGVNAGTDSITANWQGRPSNVVPVTWVAVPALLTSGPVTGKFFTADGSGVFNTPATQQPVFTQGFPNINFNPPAGSVAGNTSGVTNLTRPFTDIATDTAGNYIGPIVAQSNTYVALAGVGGLYNFGAVFTGVLNVPAAGPVTLSFSSDDAFVFGVGGGATRVSGPQFNTPAVTTFQQLAVMGGNNQRTAPVSNTIVVNFPSAGVYPYEVDYAKGGDSKLTLTMLSGGLPIPAATLLTLTPVQPAPIVSGQVQIFGLTAVNANGVALANQPVTLSVRGTNQQTQTLSTDGTGHVTFAYAGSPLLSGADLAQVSALVGGATAYSNVVTVPWNTGVNQAPVVSAGTAQTITLPGAAILNGTVSDDRLPANTLTTTWTMQSGPAAVVFDNAAQAATAVTFSQAGTYVLLLSASDGTLSATSTVTITVVANTTWSTGWILAPGDKSTVMGLAPVTLVSGITLTSGSLTYYPAGNTADVHTITATTTGSGQIGVFDTTTLANGSYFVDLYATNSAGITQRNLVLVNVVGDYKPGRVTATVTDLVVPAPGLPITISRTYDSLERGKSSDFGFGWTLGVNVKLEVSPTSDVTFTINGQRRTFYFTPQPNAIFTYWYSPLYTAEPGMYGSLVTTGDNCNGVLQRTNNLWFCGVNGTADSYQPAGFVYTDPYGRRYTVGSSGTLQSVQDLNNNTLTIGLNGISSTNGLSVPFVRDSSGRITKITDPLGNQWNYGYNAAGELATVTLPPVPGVTAVPVAFGYDAGHYLKQETDARGIPAGTTAYYPDGKLQSVTDALNKTTSFAYNTATLTTTITKPAPDLGVETIVYDGYGKMLSRQDEIGRTTIYTYDAKHNVVTETNPLNQTTTYGYDANGFKTTTQDALSHTTTTAYNAFGGQTSITNALNQVTSITYDAELNISAIVDTIGPIRSFTWNPAGLPLTETDARGNASSDQYDQYGNTTLSTDALGRTTISVHNTLGQMTSQTDARGNTTTYTYDPFGRVKTKTDPLTVCGESTGWRRFSLGSETFLA